MSLRQANAAGVISMICRFVELPSRMSPAAYQRDAFVFASEGSIRAVGVALDRSAEVVRDACT